MGEASGSQAKATRAWSERLSGWLTLGANLGVLAGLVLVIVQLNQNERMIRAQTRHEIASGIVQFLSGYGDNPQLAELIVRDNRGDELKPGEEFQVSLRITALFRMWEDVHYQSRMGLLDEEEFAREREAWRDALATNPGIRARWCGSPDIFSAEFTAEIDALIEQGACHAAAQ